MQITTHLHKVLFGRFKNVHKTFNKICLVIRFQIKRFVNVLIKTFHFVTSKERLKNVLFGTIVFSQIESPTWTLYERFLNVHFRRGPTEPV